MTSVTGTASMEPAALGLRPLSQRRAARIAGVAYLLIYALAIFANFAVVKTLVVPDDAAATVANLQESASMARAGFLAFLLVLIADLVVAWALFTVFRSTSPELARLAAWARLTYTAFLGVGLVSYLSALRLVGDADALAAFTPEQNATQVAFAMESFNDAWMIGLAVFGVHLVLIGVLLFRSGMAPRAMGWIVGFAGVAYLLDTVLRFVLPDYSQVASIMLAVVAVPSMFGEGWMALWLLRCRRFAADVRSVGLGG